MMWLKQPPMTLPLRTVLFCESGPSHCAPVSVSAFAISARTKALVGSTFILLLTLTDLAVWRKYFLFMCNVTWHGCPVNNNNCTCSHCGSQQTHNLSGWSHVPYRPYLEPHRSSISRLSETPDDLMDLGWDIGCQASMSPSAHNRQMTPACAPPKVSLWT